MGLAFVIERQVFHFSDLLPITCEHGSANELSHKLGGLRIDLSRHLRGARKCKAQEGDEQDAFGGTG
jgi:hypothetical protein